MKNKSLHAVRKSSSFQIHRSLFLFLFSQEGPHCQIKEDEFFDAVDASLDKLEKEEESVRERFVTVDRLLLVKL